MTDPSLSSATATIRPRRNLRWILIEVLAIRLGVEAWGRQAVLHQRRERDLGAQGQPDGTKR